MKAVVTKDSHVTIHDNEDNIMCAVFTENNGEYTIYLDYAYKVVTIQKSYALPEPAQSIVITKEDV